MTTSDYSSRSPELKAPRQVLWLAFVLLLLPGALMAFFWTSGSYLPQFLYSHLEHPHSFKEAYYLQWFWEERVDELGGEAALIGGVFAIALAISSQIRPARRWLQNRVPFWHLAIPIYLAIVLYVAFMPSFRN